MKKTINSRRSFAKKLTGIVFPAIFLNSLFTSCSRQGRESLSDPCTDLSELSEAEIATREQLGYIAQSTFSERTCLNCQLFVKSDQTIDCGSCLAMKGPVADGGYCTVWAPVNLQITR